MTICDTMPKQIIYSIGHSNIQLDKFIEFLESYKITRVLDVRSNPKSEYVSHFNKEKLEKELIQHHIEYTYCGDLLGGRQKINFKEYIKTKEYQEGIKHLIRLAHISLCVIMCSEKEYQGCHRRFIAESLINEGLDVIQLGYNNENKIIKQIPLME